MTDENKQENTKEQPYTLVLPMSKAKKICRLTNPNHQINQTSAQLLTFCTEYITKYILQEAEKDALRENSKQINYQHIRKVIMRTPGLAYLEDTVPEKLVVGQEEDLQNDTKQ